MGRRDGGNGRVVTAVVCAAFDAATDAAVLAVRDRVGALGVRLPARPRHRPHVTLAAVRAHEQQLPAVVDLVGAVAATRPGFDTTFGTVGSFGRAGALWIGPDDDADLRTLQRSVHEAVEAGPWPNPFGGRSRPGEWVPHCTLATRLDRTTLERVRSAVSDGLSPVPTTVAGLALILVGGSGDVALLPLSG